jgi:hypothetical protein
VAISTRPQVLLIRQCFEPVRVVKAVGQRVRDWRRSQLDQIMPTRHANKTYTPSADPSLIEVPGLDPNAPYEDQIELLDQLITLKLQASVLTSRIVHSGTAFDYSKLFRRPMHTGQRFTISSSISYFPPLNGILRTVNPHAKLLTYARCRLSVKRSH